MKVIKCLMLGLGLTLATFVFSSCLDDKEYSFDKAWYSIVTVHPIGDSSSYWFALDDGTSLWPVATNIPWFNPKEKQRVLVVYSFLSDEYKGYDHAIKILDLKSILTKSIAENLDEENDNTYGADPVSISDIWIGGGYLNIVFEFDYGGNSVHYINLLENNNVNTPYLFEFRHNAYNDDPRYRRKGIVAFDLSSVDTKGEEVELSILVNTFEGKKDEYKIKYNSSQNPSTQSRNYSMESFVEMI